MAWTAIERYDTTYNSPHMLLRFLLASNNSHYLEINPETPELRINMIMQQIMYFVCSTNQITDRPMFYKIKYIHVFQLAYIPVQISINNNYAHEYIQNIYFVCGYQLVIVYAI